MQHTLIRHAGLLALVFVATGMMLTSCVDEPDPVVADRINSEVRFVHAVPGAQPVDIWIDNAVAMPNLAYKAVNNYMTIPSGNRFIRVVPAGMDSSNAIFRRSVSMRSLMKMTIAFYGTGADPQMLITQERFTYADETSMLTDSTDVKLINLNSSGNVFGFYNGPDQATFNDLSELIAPVGYGNLSAYIRLDAGTPAPFYVANPVDVLQLSGFSLKTPGYRYTIIAVGDAGTKEALVLQDEPYAR
jgi:hypothetical protein